MRAAGQKAERTLRLTADYVPEGEAWCYTFSAKEER